VGNFRLVILDNPKQQLDSPVVQRLLADLIITKQKNFLRTDPHYVVLDKHDMVGTHYMIYETTDLLTPRLIFAIRTTFADRASQSRLETPLMALLPELSESLQTAFMGFAERHPRLVDCNAWFVDTEFSKSQSGLNLSDLGYFMVCMNILRAGYDNIIGCTNETYRASRWVEKIGSMRKDLYFDHPAVQQQHKMLLVEDFNKSHFLEVYRSHRSLVDSAYELVPDLPVSSSLGAFARDFFNERQEQPAA
jgi:hypothetical protein